MKREIYYRNDNIFEDYLLYANHLDSLSKGKPRLDNLVQYNGVWINYAGKIFRIPDIYKIFSNKLLQRYYEYI